MADYQPLIAKAVAGLERNTGEARRALYERARTALVAQLRGVTPPLSESDITRERLGLEEAIRKVEAESARKARYEPLPRPEPRAPARPLRHEPPAEHKEVGRQDERAPPQSEPRPRTDPPPEHPATTTAAELRRARPRPTGDRGSLSDEGLKGFRDVVAEAETLGEATAQAGKTAREAFASVPPPGSQAERLEPHIEPEGLRPRQRRPEPSRPREPGRVDDFGRSRELPEPPMRPPGAPETGRAPPARREWNDEPVIGMHGAEDFAADDFAEFPSRYPADSQPEEARASRRALGKPPGQAAAVARLPSSRRWLTLALVVVLGVAAVVLITWQRQSIKTALSGLTTMFSSKPVQTQREATPSRKITDRVGENSQRNDANVGKPQSAEPVAIDRRVLERNDKPAISCAKLRTEQAGHRRHDHARHKATVLF